MFLLRDLPKYESIRKQSERYPQIDPRAVEAFLVLWRTATDTLSAFECYLQKHGMSQGKFTVLMILNRHPEVGVNPSELADRAGVTRATMTGLLEGLEREKLINRQGDRTDRRRAVVRLTATARALLDGMLPDYFTRLHELMAELSEKDKEQLTELLVKIGERIPDVRSVVVPAEPKPAH
ncbi:MAG TPA: MarR family transcriptional regulator [Tepidisphaeraceae bacterium]|jgi:DNA-binding MarR family transcriptional regulator